MSLLPGSVQPSLFEGGRDAGARGAPAALAAGGRAPAEPSLSSSKALGSDSPSRADKLADLKWKRDRSTWEHWYVCREFVREHFANLNDERLVGSCSELAYAFRHRDTGDLRLRPKSCGCRGLCPACAINYGRERGKSVYSLFQTALEPGRLVADKPKMLAYGHVFTFPKWISEHFDSCITRNKLSELRRGLSELTSAISRTLDFWYGQKGVGASVNWHWWHSDRPLEGAHWHAHVDVPNASPAGVVRTFGKVSEDDLKALKVRFASEVAKCRFVAELGCEVPSELVVNYRFIMGEKQLRHRLTYDYRHPMQDFVKMAKTELPELGGGAVSWFFNRCEVLQPVQLVRHVGWLSNCKRVKVGIVRSEPEEDLWERVEGTFYRFDRFTDEGVVVTRYWSDGNKTSEFWERGRVQLLPLPRPRLYHWAGASP